MAGCGRVWENVRATMRTLHPSRNPTPDCGVSRPWSRALLIVGLVAAIGARHARAEAIAAGPSGPAKQVLIVQSYGSDFAPFNAVSSTFRSELARIWPGPLAYHEVSLDPAGRSGEATEGPFVAYLRSIVSERAPDLVVLIGGPAVRFGVARRDRIFPSLPLLSTGFEQRLIPAGALTANDAVVAVVYDFPALVEHILRVVPKTEDVVVIIGSSPMERFWRGEIARELEPLADRVRLTFWDGLSLEEMVSRAASLPPRSAILYTTLHVDGAGIPHAFDASLERLHAASSAPIFGLFDTQLGLGLVGGSLYSVAELSRHAARAACGILRGEPPSGYRLPPATPGPPVFDWRELRRWGIREDALPPGSTVRFGPPPAWTLYQWPIASGLAAIVVLAALVVALNLHRVRRRAAEREVRNLSRRLLTASEEERRWLARELHDDVAQRLARLAIDASRLEREGLASTQSAELGSMREAIASLSADIHALSHHLHPSLLDHLGVAEALRAEAERFSRVEAIAVELRLDDLRKQLPPDSALCLYRVAQESLRNVARHAQATKVEISLRAKDGTCELEVRDDGVGFDGNQRRGAGLGLASMGERVLLVGGRLAIRSTPHRGTAVIASVPLPRGAS
jgi:signal transduction histidine kinase